MHANGYGSVAWAGGGGVWDFRARSESRHQDSKEQPDTRHRKENMRLRREDAY